MSQSRRCIYSRVESLRVRICGWNISHLGSGNFRCPRRITRAVVLLRIIAAGWFFLQWIPLLLMRDCIECLLQFQNNGGLCYCRTRATQWTSGDRVALRYSGSCANCATVVFLTNHTLINNLEWHLWKVAGMFLDKQPQIWLAWQSITTVRCYYISLL